LSEILTTFASKLFFELLGLPHFVTWPDEHAGILAKKVAFVKKTFLDYIAFQKSRKAKK